MNKGIKRADEAALVVHELVASGTDDAIPDLLTVAVQVVIAQVRKTAHTMTVVPRAPPLRGTGPVG